MRIGFIGGNELSLSFLRDFNTNTNVTETHLIEQDILKSRNMIKSCEGINYHVESSAFLKSIDSLIICGSHKKSHEIIIDAAKSGKHIILADPHLLPIGVIRKLEQLEKEAGIVIQVGSSEKYNSAFMSAKPFIKNPVFIDVARLIQYSPKNKDISVLNDLLFKDLDWVLSLINSNIRKVSANSVSVASEEIDFINTKLEFDNGCIVNLTASRVSELNLNKARVYNSNSILFVDLLNKQLKHSLKKNNDLEVEELIITVNDDRVNQFNEFKDVCLGKAEITSNLSGFLKTREILEVITDKIRAKTSPFLK